jgi:hypothetical protein
MGTSPRTKPRRKTLGLALVAMGVLVPILLLLFTSGYNPEASIITNILHLRIAVGRVFAVPYRFPLAFCIFIIFLGIRELEGSRGIATEGDEQGVS